jgi:acetyltransferase-like isoleucine patch superfamily enzyme
MKKILKKISQKLSTKRVGDLIIGRNVKFENKGKISSGRSYLGAIDNLTVKIIARRKEKSSFINLGEFSLGNNVRIHKNFGIYIGEEAKFSMGNNSYINPEVTIFCKKEISIGSNCVISWRCQFLDDDLHSIIAEGKRINPPLPIIVGNHVWIGADVKLLPGALIEDGVIVAAGSIVKGKLDAYCLYGGVPARKIKEQIEWE